MPYSRANLLVRLLPLAALALCTFVLPAQDSIRTIPFVNSIPTGIPPQGAVWSPDGSRLTWQATDTEIGQPGDIVQVDAATGQPSVLVSLAQLARMGSDEINEKDQDHRSRYNMSAFLWADDSKHLLFDLGGRLFLWDIASASAQLVVDTGAGSGDDPKFSPDAKSVSYLRNHNLYVHPVAPGANRAAGKETALTADTVPTLLNGEVDWVYLEELDVRSNYFWAPDSSAIAYLQADEARVPEYPIVDFIPTHATLDAQRYPQPGDPNPSVRVGVVPATGGPTRWIALPFSAGNDYIPRFGWIDPHTLYIEVLRRDQKSRSLFFADTRTGKTREAWTDTDPKYLAEAYDITRLDHGRFVVNSWRAGFSQLYLYRFDEQHPLAAQAKLLRKLTPAPADVFSVDGFDPAANTLFYTSNAGTPPDAANPLDQKLYRVSLDGGAPVRITQTPGVHDSLVAPDHQHFADAAGTLTDPATGRICTLSASSTCKDFWRSTPIPPAAGVTASIVTFTAADGHTRLYGTLTMPANSAAPASIPIILNPYGGPLPTPGVHNAFNPLLFSELLAQHGFAVLEVDNRGSGGRGRDFQQACFRNFGQIQLADQLAALDQTLAAHPQLDPHRVGWWGWSWGGSFTLYAMTHTDRIKAGVAVAPVTDFRNYDSIYTERYLGQPAETADAYNAASDVLAAPNLKGRLLIAQGTGDDNVHMANTIQFLDPLIDAGIPYDLQLFPRKTHSIAGLPSRNELFNRILIHFETWLK